ncbi:MAG: bifunctional glycosyltransferase family 2/GtrA family protein [Oscillospiraceae bacterium]|nr:bifunctional glycosyltransferase family 2/GtrA family protein [Oscillospiraceae bacterium]
MTNRQLFALIPAYEPDARLTALAEQLARRAFTVVIVDDGSSASCAPVFAAAERCATVLHHAENRGKGAALKTGLASIASQACAPYTVVTVDADGQHRLGDVLRVVTEASAHTDSLVLGSRGFQGDVPLRSRLGNAVTRLVYRLCSGARVYDTQTGLRAFSDALVPELLAVEGARYEYEMNVLMDCARRKRPIREVRIETVYLDGNASSHFDALRDSWRIYRSILRFSAASLCGFAIDYVLFCALSGATGLIAASNVAARLVSAVVNYSLNRRMVFRSDAPMRRSAVQYALLAAVILLCNTALLELLSRAGLALWLAKLFTELTLFSLSYLVQSKWIFRKEQKQYEKA